MSDPIEMNRSLWEAWAVAHGQDAYYDTAGLVAGADSLGSAERAGLRAALGRENDLSGLNILHVQCHIGFDTVSLARRGAQVTGTDFSATALAKAADIAARAGVTIDWVEAEATALPSSLHGRFDLAYATIGVLCWIGDIDAWMRSVAAALAPDGQLVLYEMHPLFCALAGPDWLELEFPYGGAEPQLSAESSSYAVPDALLEAMPTVQYAHSLGEVVTAAADAGLAVRRLEEHLEADRDPRGMGPEVEPDGRYRLRSGGHPLPIMFTLIAQKVSGQPPD
jgi:SAM-dependent methyltransferase